MIQTRIDHDRIDIAPGAWRLGRESFGFWGGGGARDRPPLLWGTRRRTKAGANEAENRGGKRIRLSIKSIRERKGGSFGAGGKE